MNKIVDFLLSEYHLFIRINVLTILLLVVTCALGYAYVHFLVG